MPNVLEKKIVYLIKYDQFIKKKTTNVKILKNKIEINRFQPLALI